LRKRPTRRFAFDDKYDFGYRPATYWEELPGDRTLLAKIRGTARRRIAERALDGEQLPRLCGEELYREAIEFVLAEELTAEKRGSWGRIDPMMLGGECLPSLSAGETEIVRIELRSTTFDLIELRAWMRHGRIRYRVVFERFLNLSSRLCGWRAGPVSKPSNTICGFAGILERSNGTRTRALPTSFVYQSVCDRERWKVIARRCSACPGD
jgi:hypothetical protein